MSATHGGGFSPSSLDNLELWLDAGSGVSDGGAGPIEDGDAVESWTGRGPNAGVASQSTVAKRPEYKTGIINGKPVVRFDGVDDLLTHTFGSSLSQANTIFVVGNINGAGPEYFIDGLDGSNRHIIYRSGGNWFIFSGANVSGGTSDANKHIFTAVFNGASSSLRVDGASVLSGNAGAHSVGGLTIGANNSESILLDGDIAELIVYSDSLTTDERDQVEEYLSGKYGISLP